MMLVQVSHGARLVHLIITMIKWFRTSRLSINNSLCWCRYAVTAGLGLDKAGVDLAPGGSGKVSFHAISGRGHLWRDKCTT